MDKQPNYSSRRTILIDVDHSISNAFWRDPMIGANDWNEYHAASIGDEPIWDTLYLLRALSDDDYNIVALTARPEKWRQLTMSWMHKFAVPVDELLMRADENYRSAPELKLELVAARFGDRIKDEVAFMIDDREDVIDAMRGLGISCMQIFARKD